MPVFTVIDHQEFGSDTTEWSKGSIPTSYDHLLVKASTRSTRSGAEYGAFTIKLGHQSQTSNYFVTELTANTSTAYSDDANGYTGEFQAGWQPAANALSGSYGIATLWIPHYSQGDNYKQMLLTLVFPNNSTTDSEWQVTQRACCFKFGTSDKRAISAVAMRRNWNDFAAGSSFTLYGVKGA